MSEVVNWQGSAIDVQAWLVPRLLWTTASIDVFLDEFCILRTGGSAKLAGSTSSTFTHSGSTHTAELSWGMAGLLPVFPYRLQIDGITIATSRVGVRNWPLLLIPSVLLAVVLLVISHFVHPL
jgi:hypothetical protein